MQITDHNSDLFDIHTHGAGGGSFDDILHGGEESFLKVKSALNNAGTSQFLIGLITKPWDDMLETVRIAAKLCEKYQNDGVNGIYLEGPFISPLKKGAHNPNYLIIPENNRLRELLDAANGNLKMVTIAPELSCGMEAVEFLESKGVVAAIGHTDADYALVSDVIDNANAHHFTHLFNAMNPIGHRAPGPVIAALDAHKKYCHNADRRRITVEIINDGIHLADPIVKWAFDEFKQPVYVDLTHEHLTNSHQISQEYTSNIILVSDSMSATTLNDGNYKLGDLDVEVKNGKAVIKGTDTIAGSTLTLKNASVRAKMLGIDDSMIVDASIKNPLQLFGIN